MNAMECPMNLKQSNRDFLKRRRWELGPAWRWMLAQQNLGEGLPNGFRRASPALTRIWRYLNVRALNRRDEAPPDATTAALATADRLNADVVLAGTLKMMVLGGFSEEEICARTKLDRRTFRVWRQAFFDIEPFRKVAGWISWQVIEPEIIAGNHRLAAKLVSAYGGGRRIVDLILRAEVCFPKDEVERKQYGEIEMTLRTREALMVPFQSEKQRMQQIKRYLEWLAREKRAEVAKARAEAKTAAEQRRLMVAEYQNKRRVVRNQKMEQSRLDRQREQLEIVNATAQMREILLADLEKRWHREREETLAHVAQSPLSSLKWKSSKSIPQSQIRSVPSVQPLFTIRAGVYTATYLDGVDLLATSPDGPQITTVFVGSDIDQVQLSASEVNVCEWNMSS